MAEILPRRFLFIASIGNMRPYRSTRHSAGHILLDALTPLLPTSLPASRYKTWYSPSFMNDSGPKLARQLNTWMGTSRSDALRLQRAVAQTASAASPAERGFQPTLVILHDELEAPLGKIKVKRGGAESASLRGHRGLISVMESLRGKGLYPPSAKSPDRLSIMRIGVGIGRPSTRNRGDVADYVLTEMNQTELAAVKAAAGSVADMLVEELYRDEV